MARMNYEWFDGIDDNGFCRRCQRSYSTCTCRQPTSSVSLRFFVWQFVFAAVVLSILATFFVSPSQTVSYVVGACSFVWACFASYSARKNPA